MFTPVHVRYKASMSSQAVVPGSGLQQIDNGNDRHDKQSPQPDQVNEQPRS